MAEPRPTDRPTERMIDAGALHLRARDWGGPDAQPPVLLVHGLASNARIWDLVAPRLAAGRRTVAIDQRGHGGSGKPDEGYDFAAITADLRGAVAALGMRRPLLVGHSWGASVVLRAAADDPELASGLVLVDGGTGDLQGRMSLEEALVRLAPPRLAGTPRGEFLARVRARWEAMGWGPEVESIIMGNFAVDSEDRIAPHLTFDRHLQIVRAMWEQRAPELFPRVACPVLIVPAESPEQGEEARAFQEVKEAGVRAAAAALPRATVAWARATVHDIPLHRPAWLADQIAAFASSLAAG